MDFTPLYEVSPLAQTKDTAKIYDVTHGKGYYSGEALMVGSGMVTAFLILLEHVDPQCSGRFQAVSFQQHPGATQVVIC